MVQLVVVVTEPPVKALRHPDDHVVQGLQMIHVVLIDPEFDAFQHLGNVLIPLVESGLLLIILRRAEGLAVEKHGLLYFIFLRFFIFLRGIAHLQHDLRPHPGGRIQGCRRRADLYGPGAVFIDLIRRESADLQGVRDLLVPGVRHPLVQSSCGIL